MHSFIVQQFETPDSPDTYKIVPETSIGIAEVRQTIKFLSQKPTQSPNNIIVFYNAHLLTIPAQNAILKILEEPPANSLIYLVTDNPDQLLPTILSRCQIENKSPQVKPAPEKLAHAEKLLQRLTKSGVGERLKILEEQEFTRITALEFLDNLEFVIHQNINTPSRTSPPKLGGDHRGGIYEIVVIVRKYLKANCNLKLSMDYLAVHLPPPTPS